MKKVFIFVILGLIFLAGCTQKTETAVERSRRMFSVFSKDEVGRHASTSDCWTIISGKVYDITDYLSLHPGGIDRIKMACGVDATVLFNTQGGQGQHPQSAKDLLNDYLLGDLTQ